ncbi:SAVED domain-containing protein [Brachyspira pilosicoli]|uniref:SAVED domain-containing protein n=1 Tax=Brachyspira pilosicoli TaxID=52584 RepID=UPI001E49F4AC|nr:SAVED domain-containing protein [Brachyspira pilosicoli]
MAENKNVKIFHSIRGLSQNFGEIPKVDLEINLDNEYNIYKYKDDNIIKKLKNIIISKLEEANITKQDKIMLYAIAPNSILVSIAFILEKYKYNFDFLPKPKDSLVWGYSDIDISDPELTNFIESKSTQLRISNINHPIGIILSGRSNVDNIEEVYKDNENLIINKGFDYSYTNIITITHEIRLQENSDKSLVNKKCYEIFVNEINSIFNDIVSYKNIKEVHILSSIPANGLLYLGKKIADYKNNHLIFYIYNYISHNDRYELGAILNGNLIDADSNILKNSFIY